MIYTDQEENRQASLRVAHNVMRSQNSLGWKGLLKGIQLSSLCSKQGHPHLDQVVQSLGLIIQNYVLTY